MRLKLIRANGTPATIEDITDSLGDTTIDIGDVVMSLDDYEGFPDPHPTGVDRMKIGLSWRTTMNPTSRIGGRR